MGLPSGFTQKLNSRGIAHHALIAILVIVGFAGFGAWRIYQSQALTDSVGEQYLFKQSNETGCWAAGRIWENGKCKGTKEMVGTNKPCRNKNDVYRQKVGSDGAARGFCNKAVAQNVDAKTCVNVLHRMYINEVGCALRMDQEDTNKARQCVGNNVPASDPLAKYKNYIAEVEGKKDRCVEDKIAPTPPPNQEVTDQISDPKCSALGRKMTEKGCARVCLPNAGSLLIDSANRTGGAADTYYCSLAVAGGISEQRCAELHRRWVDAGCSRRPDQKDNANDKVHCIAGYPYYRSNSEASRSERLDVCEKDKATADANQAAGIVGTTPDGQPILICKGGQIKQPDGSCACPAGQILVGDKCQTPGTPPGDPQDCPLNARWSAALGKCVCTADGSIADHVCPDPPGDPPADPDEVVSLETGISQRDCTLLYGRAWEVGLLDDGTTGTGCSRETCDDPRIKKILTVNDGESSVYCKGYAEQISKKQCTQVHRKWLGLADVCAQYPKQGAVNKALTGALQCEENTEFDTYIVRTGVRDQCLETTTVQQMQYLASRFNVPFKKVAKLGPMVFCNTVRNKGYHWVEATGKCVKDRETPDSDSSRVTKVLTFVIENHTEAQMKTGMNYAFNQGKKYGYTTKFTGSSRPSLPNYIVMAAGSDMGVHDNNAPAQNKLQGATVFGKAIAAGKTAKIYADGMNGNCSTDAQHHDYAARHNPWVYFVDERNLCKKYDVPFKGNFDKDVKNGKLPNIGMVIPDNCNNAHNIGQGCTLKTADNWFKKRMELIYKSPDWKSGRLVVVLTADEGAKSQKANTVLTVVMHPSLEGKVVNTPMDHKATSKLMAQVAGIQPLRNAQNAPSIMKLFKLGGVIQDDNGNQQPGPSGPKGSADFRAASFNVLGKSHTNGPNQNSNGADFGPRLHRAVKIMREHEFDVVGLQEFQPDQRKMLMGNYGKTFGIYPREPQYGGGGASVNSIIWREAKFAYVDGGTRKFRYFGGSVHDYPWVKLRDRESNRIIVVANTHDPADTRGNVFHLRVANARDHLRNMTDFINKGFPVVFVGDLNSGTNLRPGDGNDRSRLPYCILSSNGKLHNAYDAWKNRRTGGKCPSPTNSIRIDQVWVDTKSDVRKYVLLKNGDVNFATDHKQVTYADVVVGK